ncbi:MAG TPA: LptF/LptG family permease [Opitutaceae bacterium]
MFRTLDRHVVFEWLQILGLVVGATFGLQMIFSLYDTYKDLRDFGASAGEMALYYLVRSPSNLSLVVPIATLVSLLYAFGLLHRHSEITAMRAAGIGLLRITWWVWVIAAGLSLLMFYLNGSVIPWSVEQSRMLFENLKFSHQAEQAVSGEAVGVINNIGYHDRIDHRVWMISRFSQYSNRAFGIQLYLMRPDGSEERRILAAEGFWDEVEQGWTFFRGRETTFGLEDGEIARTLAFEKKELRNVDDDPRWMMRFEKRPKDLSFFELGSILNSPEAAEHPRLAAYSVRYHSLMAGAFSCLIVAGLAVPFAVSGVRVNPAVGVSKSLALFFLFYLLATIGTMLGDQGAVPPWVAAWLPNSFMACLAGWLMIDIR